MEIGIFYILIGTISIAAFLLGKYVYPELQSTVETALNTYPILMKWGIAACQYMKQYCDSTGEAKHIKVAEILVELASQAGIELSTEQARAVAQSAYDEWIKGVASNKEEVAHDGNKE